MVPLRALLSRLTGSTVDYCAADSHWQLGEIEAYNRAFQYASAKIVDQYQLAGEQDMKTLAAQVGQAMNSSIRRQMARCKPWKPSIVMTNYEGGIRFGQPRDEHVAEPVTADAAEGALPLGPAAASVSAATDDTQLPPTQRLERQQPELPAPPAKKIRIDDVLPDGAELEQAPRTEAGDVQNILVANRYFPLTDEEYFAWRNDFFMELEQCIFPRVVLETRKQQKALVREIPWHLIPEDEREGYREALLREWGAWLHGYSTRL